MVPKFRRAVPVLLLAIIFTAIAHAGTIYVGDAFGQLWSVNVHSGESNLVCNMSATMTDLAMLSPTRLLGVDYGVLYDIDISSGKVEPITSLHGSVNALAAGPDGRVYYTGLGGQLYAADPANGSSTWIAGFGVSAAGDLEFDDSGNLYMASVNADLLVLRAGTSQVAKVGKTGFYDIYGLAYENGVLYGTTLSGKLLSIDRNNGSAFVLASTGIPANGAAAYVPAAVPEPGTIILTGLGLGSLLTRRLTHRR